MRAMFNSFPHRSDSPSHAFLFSACYVNPSSFLSRFPAGMIVYDNSLFTLSPEHKPKQTK